MKQKLELRICDQCKKEESFNPEKFGNSGFPGWISMTVNSVDRCNGQTKNYDFCSAYCCRQFMESPAR
jgi:hypothetical protein